jgi:hypothetical protein
MRIEIYSVNRFGVEKVDEVREYSEDWMIEEIIKEVLVDKWGSEDEVIGGIGKIMGEEFKNIYIYIYKVVEEIVVEKESIDDGMGYRIDEERYLRIVEEV